MEQYTKAATADSPAHIIYLLDASGSMNMKLEGKPRSEWLEEALEIALDKMLSRSFEGGIYHERYKIAVITYSNKVDSSLTNHQFVDVKEFWDVGIPQIKPGGETNTKAAFEFAYQLLSNLLKDPNVQKKCPAPLICHVTDGAYNITGDPQPTVDKIKNLQTHDGTVLIQNLFISDDLLALPIKDVSSWTGFTSADVTSAFKNDYAHSLFQMSSSLPTSYASVLADNGFNLKPGSKMMFPGQNFDLIRLAFVASTSTPFSS